MKIVVIADTHGTLQIDKIENIFNVDIVILLGDIYRNELRIIEYVFKNTPIIGIYGNHDTENLYDETSIIDIHKNIYSIDNSLIQGFRGSVKYKPNQLFGYTQKESIQEFKHLAKCDILCCHDGPYKYGINDAHIGLKGITKYVKRNRPKILLFGHHHKNNHFKLYHTDCYNVYGVSIFTIENNKVID